MDFWRAILGLVRRRYVALPIMILSIGVAALAYLITPPHYVSSTTMVLTTPTTGGTLSQDPNKPTGLTNPLLNFDDGLKTTSAILIQAMNTPDLVKELTAGGAKLTINDGSSNASLLGVNGPFVFIEADSQRAGEAKAIVQRTQQRVRDELVNRQKALNAPPSTYITIVDVVPPSVPEIQRGPQLQFAIAGLVLTILGGLAGAYGAERIFAARRKRPTTAEPVRPSAARRVDQNAADPVTVRFTPVPHPTNGSPVPANGRPVPANGNPVPANGSPVPATNGVDAPMPKPVRTS
jgi:hypothetical protein